MQRTRAREILLACAFVFCGCKKHESIASTTTSTATPTVSVAAAAPIEQASASSEPSASATAPPASSIETEAAARARKQAALREAAEFGMLGLIGDADGGDLGLTGVGGSGGIGTFGLRDGGYGVSIGRTNGPSVRVGVLQVQGQGRLPTEVIQRIIRRNLNLFRTCYASGLSNNPKLQGRVTTRFVIDRSGAVNQSRDDGSDLPDQTVVQCVVRAFGTIAYPQPEGGLVSVVAPVMFSPAP